MTDIIHEPARDIPVAADVDICVLGGSCTGVFAAVRAARLGAKVALVEARGKLGGVATNGLVSVWHSLYDTLYEEQIIAGLTQETAERLKRRGAVHQLDNNPHAAFVLNTEELSIELDELLREANVRPFLHTWFAAPLMDGGRVAAVCIEDKTGRRAIRAKQFIDATGDGDLCQRMGLETYTREPLQPPTACARFGGWRTVSDASLKSVLNEHRDEYDLPPGFIWGQDVPGSDVHMIAGTRVKHADCSDADALTAAEIEGRRQVRAMMDILHQHIPGAKLVLQALPSWIGIRETRHVRCKHQLTQDQVLYGERFPDAIANGSYRVDVHHQDRPGITLKYLDGTMHYSGYDGSGGEGGRWRPEMPEAPTFYQIPFRSLVPEGSDNVLLAGRMLDADEEAFGAARVMVNLNQTGEAAGVGAYLALSSETPVGEIDATEVRRLLADGGSIII